MLSFNSWAFAKRGQGKQIEALASIMAAISISHEGGCTGSKCGRAQRNTVKSLSKKYCEKSDLSGGKGHGKKTHTHSHTCKRTNLTYNWITRGKLLNANHDLLGEGPRPEHLRDQAFATRLLCCQLTATEQHFICLKRRRVDNNMRYKM